MRTLSTTLLAAQKSTSHKPYIKVSASNKIAGVVRLDWTRLYTGNEDDYLHALTMPGDGSFIRARLTPAADGNKLYRQQVANPAPGADFSNWTYTGQYNCLAVAAASLGSEVSIFWINDSREVRRIKSVDNGANWGSPELIDYSPTTAVSGMAAAYKPNGDMAIFFTDQASLYVKKHTGGSWQEKTAWDKTTGTLSGIAAVYDSDWNLVVGGQDGSGNYKLWSLIYGDGGDVPAGTWSALKELASSPADGDFRFCGISLDKPDVFRCFYSENFSGSQSYNRPFWSHSVIDSPFVDNLWREPIPFNLQAAYGLAIAHHGDYCWLSTSSGVWRACLTIQSLDVSDDVVSLKEELEENRGQASIELRNDKGDYALLPYPLEIGCQLDIEPGYFTPQGNESSPGLYFNLEAYEHFSAGGQARLRLYVTDGWAWLNNWRARYQFRWNRSSGETTIKQILEYMLARAGLKLETVSESDAITGSYPDFTINPGNSGDAIVKKLLSFVPDLIFIEGNKAYLLNPLSSDDSVYSYGGEHTVSEGRYEEKAWRSNRVQVEGYDSSASQSILVETFAWSQIDKLYDRFSQIEDRNLDTQSSAGERGITTLRQKEIASSSGNILVPVNCGQQIYDVIDITDSRAGFEDRKKRVLGMVLVYEPASGRYQHRLTLGAV